jgi:hypothetical protein
MITYARAVMALVQISTERELRLRATLNLMGLRVRVHIHLGRSLIIDRVSSQVATHDTHSYTYRTQSTGRRG